MDSPEYLSDQQGGEHSPDEVHMSFEHDPVTNRDEVRIWGTSSALPVDLSTAEWLVLCRAIRDRGEDILYLTSIGSKVVIRVDGSA